MKIHAVKDTDDHPARGTISGGRPGDHDDPGMRTASGEEFAGKVASDLEATETAAVVESPEV